MVDGGIGNWKEAVSEGSGIGRVAVTGGSSVITKGRDYNNVCDILIL